MIHAYVCSRNCWRGPCSRSGHVTCASSTRRPHATEERYDPGEPRPEDPRLAQLLFYEPARLAASPRPRAWHSVLRSLRAATRLARQPSLLLEPPRCSRLRATLEPVRFRSNHPCHPGRSEAESRDPGSTVIRLGPGYFAHAKFRDDNRTFPSETETKLGVSLRPRFSRGIP